MSGDDPGNKALNEIGLFGNQNTVCQPTTPRLRHSSATRSPPSGIHSCLRKPPQAEMLQPDGKLAGPISVALFPELTWTVNSNRQVNDRRQYVPITRD
jgi:hypothetical protein